MAAKINKIQKFIKANGLDFSGSGSGLNGSCVILAGYALYLELTLDELKGLMTKKQLETSSDELERVFEFADYRDYGVWWISDEAKEQYIF